jgi:transposase
LTIEDWAWQRLAEILTPWYEQIAEQAKKSAYLHADETGWRVHGQSCWLWCFANHQNCYYLIDRCRGSPVLQRFFGDAFDGILLHDFWPAYESIDVADRQYCLVHLLRELEKVDQHNASREWQAFAKTLRRLLRDGIRLRKRSDFSPQRYPSRILRLGRRLDAVILRKNSQSNRSDRGAATQAVLMSVYRTLQLRDHDPLQTISAALRTYLATGHLPQLPAADTANG